MFATINYADGSAKTYEVADEIYAEMKEAFRSAQETMVHELADGGIARVDWKRAESLTVSETDPSLPAISIVGGEDEPIFTKKSMEQW